MDPLTELRCEPYVLGGISKLNAIVGRNGSGKSQFIRNLARFYLQNREGFNAKYISPERGGSFISNPTLETNINSNNLYLDETRDRNQAENFKNGSAYLLRQLETTFLRRLDRNAGLRTQVSRTFASEYLDKINSLLINLSIEQSDAAGASFIFRSFDGQIVRPADISSGESEAVALASEVLHFFATVRSDQYNILFIDEPDVHQHPDLQARFASLLIEQIDILSSDCAECTYVVLATHSTPLVCDLAKAPYLTIGTKNFGKEEVNQRSVDSNLKKAAPFFAHPLSKSISDDPIFIIEGDDDERVWQQAARSSKGVIKLYPCIALTVDQQGSLEKFVSEILSAIYDSPIGFSVRDGDGKVERLADVGPLKRFRLQCYAIENLLLTDECLIKMNSTWLDFCGKTDAWTKANPSHRDHDMLRGLITAQDRYRHTKIKSIRQLICSILDINKPWEVVVGQALGAVTTSNLNEVSQDSIVDFLGHDLLTAILN